MRIAIVSYFKEEISDMTHSGIEAFTFQLTKGLKSREEITSVDVYGVGRDFISDSKVSFIPLIPVGVEEYLINSKLIEKSIEKDSLFTKVQYDLAIKAFAKMMSKKYDIIHDNSTIPIFSSLAKFMNTPVVTTLHTVANTASITIPYALNLFDSSSKNNFVCISETQMQSLSQLNMNLNISKVIHNGISSGDYDFSDETSNKSYGLWLGRIDRNDNKGLKQAITSSHKLGKELTVVGMVDDKEYFESEIKEIIHTATFISRYINFEEKKKYYKEAAYLLYPLQWEEPFGLVFLEAMASGTPIISFDRGDIPDIIKDGETGFIVNFSENDKRGEFQIKSTGMEGIEEAIEKISSMDPSEYKKMRQKCKDHVEKYFSSEQMTDEYVQVYKSIISGSLE